MRTERTLPAQLALTITAALLPAAALTACGDDNIVSTPSGSSTPTPSDSITPSPTVQGKVIQVTIRGDQIEPSGERLTVHTGELITLDVDSDRAGQLHVHSTPEQELSFIKGESSLRLTIDKPGIVDIEDHTSDTVIVSLEVQ